MAKAKEILGDTVCIRGNVPLSVLATGKPEDVEASCKKLIDVVGKGGGYIMDSSTGLDDAKPENVKAMFEFTREYGVY
jgi:uroporphyrinogen-III decarboxylase